MDLLGIDKRMNKTSKDFLIMDAHTKNNMNRTIELFDTMMRMPVN